MLIDCSYPFANSILHDFSPSNNFMKIFLLTTSSIYCLQKNVQKYKYDYSCIKNLLISNLTDICFAKKIKNCIGSANSGCYFSRSFARSCKISMKFKELAPKTAQKFFGLLIFFLKLFVCALENVYLENMNHSVVLIGYLEKMMAVLTIIDSKYSNKNF